MKISKISKLVLAIFLLLSVKCICKELGSLTSYQKIALIREEVIKIQIPDYEKPEDIELNIHNIKTEELDIKFIDATKKNLEKELINAGLSEEEISIMKGIIFVSQSSFKSFNFETKNSFNDYDLRFSQFVGFAQKLNDSIEITFVNVVVTATLSLPYHRLYKPVYKTNDKVAYDNGRRITTHVHPTAKEMYSISTFLREYTKNELLEFTELDS